MAPPLHYEPARRERRGIGAGDALVLLALGAGAYVVARLAFAVPAVIRGPEISLAPRALPWYALLSTGRMALAYLLSLAFSLAYGYVAARNLRARTVMMPLLDVLQSVPILSFLPVVLLGLSVVLPVGFAAEMASIILIFTSQAWNMTFSFYQSVTTIPTELREAAAVFRLGRWLRFRTLELPFAAVGLIWNSMVSWAGGWFFLMASEIFNVGARDFRLPGLGSYLQSAANAGDVRAVLLGLSTLVLIIVAMDQVLWRPLLAWAHRFKIETIETEGGAAEPWLLDLLRGSRIAHAARATTRAVLGRFERGVPATRSILALDNVPASRWGWPSRAVGAIAVLALAYFGVQGFGLLVQLRAADWLAIGVGLLATFARVAIALVLALLWTVPLGVAIGTSDRLARVLQPVVQVLASVPATALFPIVVAMLATVRGGLSMAAIALMLMGTQWYLLFNVIAGTTAIPKDLRDTAAMLGLSRVDRWRTLILPALFPFVITGAITASGGAWNASIVAEFVQFGGRTLSTPGVGSVIARATAEGRYPLLLAGTLTLVLTVVLINRYVWARLYRIAGQRFRMD